MACEKEEVCALVYPQRVDNLHILPKPSRKPLSADTYITSIDFLGVIYDWSSLEPFSVTISARLPHQFTYNNPTWNAEMYRVNEYSQGYNADTKRGR
jgi:hypothetical protein